MRVLNNNPFGYKNIDELFRLYVTPRFEKLEKSRDIGEYYDFINAVGVLFNWIREINNQYVENCSETLRLFKAFYNNIKHHNLNDIYDNSHIYVYEDYEYILKCKNETTTFDENGVWSDKGYWQDDCSVLGDSGELVYILEIRLNDNSSYNERNQIYLYELCKRAYMDLKDLLQNN